MKYVLSRYNQDTSWIRDYTSDYILYDRSEIPEEGAIVVPNLGTDIADKFSYIIDNYDNLPDVVLLSKCNLFKYITKEEFEAVKDNEIFTPLLTQNHKVYKRDGVDICFYKDGMYFEKNDGWYLNAHPCRNPQTQNLVANMIGIADMAYVPFAPGSNYILTKENIRQNTKQFYQTLRSYLMWDRYPGEAQLIERGLFTIWS